MENLTVLDGDISQRRDKHLVQRRFLEPQREGKDLNKLLGERINLLVCTPPNAISTKSSPTWTT